MDEVPLPNQPTLESLAAEIRKLQERVADLEDLNDLDEAIERNAGAPGVPWEEARRNSWRSEPFVEVHRES